MCLCLNHCGMCLTGCQPSRLETNTRSNIQLLHGPALRSYGLMHRCSVSTQTPAVCGRGGPCASSMSATCSQKSVDFVA